MQIDKLKFGKLVSLVVLMMVLVLTTPSMPAGSALADELPATLQYNCDFPFVSSPDGYEKAKNFSLKFILETASGKAVMIGNQGLSDVTTVNGSYGLTFLETLSTGAVQTTTITYGTSAAVHSRHTMIAKEEIIPSQYYGNCDVTPRQ